MAIDMTAAAEMARSSDAAPHWLTLLGVSEQGGRDETPRVEGAIPPELRGSLYRNGPGLFERGGRRKPHLLDGDGLVQRLSFAVGKARYQNAFVRTDKFIAEEKAGRYLYPTWSMPAPGGPLANLGGKVESQAGVTVWPVGGRLYTMDEVGPAWTLDPDTLATLGTEELGNRPLALKAHTKFDPVTGDWLLAGTEFGAAMTIHAVTRGAHGGLKSHHVARCPRQVYIHDFFATARHFIFLLHPMLFSPWRLLAGLSSFIDCLSWKPQDGNLVMLLPRDGGAPRFFEAPGAFMWHALNAYEDGDTIIADFVGYDAPDHFAPHEAQLYRLMGGRMGVAKAPGTLRRYRIAEGGLTEETLDSGTHEFPIVDPRAALGRHRMGYFSAGGEGVFNSAVKRFDFDSGHSETFDFGPRAAVGEPVFAPRPGGAVDEGWLIVQVLDGASETSFFALFDAAHVADGPLAKLWLPHHLPISFHGAWAAA